ncbi:SFR15 protein, partial [Polypterus senegalus]
MEVRGWEHVRCCIHHTTNHQDWDPNAAVKPCGECKVPLPTQGSCPSSAPGKAVSCACLLPRSFQYIGLMAGKGPRLFLQQILQTFQQPPKPQSPVVDNNTMVQVQVLSSHLKSPSSQTNELKTTFDKKLLDRFDYDDEPEGGEEFKKEDSTPPPIPALSPKRRRSRSNSRCRRSRHRRSRSRSRDRRRHSPRSRSQERREREKERERRQKGLPPLKTETLSVCSTTLWVGQLDKRTQQQDVASLLEEFGQIESINMIPPRGCAYIVMVHRQDAYRALQKLSRGSFKVNQKAIKIAWALNKGIKPEYKQYWDVELGVTYVPWIKVKMEDLDSFCEGGILDIETLCPEWKNISNDAVQADEKTHNGGSESVPTEEASVAAVVQVTGIPPIPVQPPTFPGHMGIPPPGFPPGIPPPPPPPPPFLRPGFNPLQMPPGFLPPAPLPPLGTGASIPTNNSSVVPAFHQSNLIGQFDFGFHNKRGRAIVKGEYGKRKSGQEARTVPQK